MAKATVKAGDAGAGAGVVAAAVAAISIRIKKAVWSFTRRRHMLRENSARKIPLRPPQAKIPIWKRRPRQAVNPPRRPKHRGTYLAAVVAVKAAAGGAGDAVVADGVAKASSAATR